MRHQPRLDIAAAFRRQLVVDEGMQLVFGDGNRWIGHCRCLFSVEILPVFFPPPSPRAGERRKTGSLLSFPQNPHTQSRSSFHPPQRRAFALQRSLHVSTGARKARHYGADRHALDIGDLAVAQAFQHHQKQHRALLLHQRRQRAGDVAAFGFGTAGVGIVVEQRGELRPPRQRSPPVLVEVGQDGVEPAPDIAAQKQPFQTQRPRQRVLHQIVGDVDVARQRTRIPAQRRNHGFDTLAKRGHCSSIMVRSGRRPLSAASTPHTTNTSARPLFRWLRLREADNRIRGADWDCTGRGGWCTSRPVGWVSGVLAARQAVAAVECRALAQGRIGNRMAQVSGLMQGKRGGILGVANNRSIAWGIAKACRAAGAEIALTWQGDALKKRVEPLAKEIDGILLGHCDVADPATIDAVFDVLLEKWGKIDFVVHAIAFSDKDQLDGRYLETTAENFSRTMLISCYSLTAIAQRAEKLLTDGGSILTLTYYGAEKWMPHYNVMGVAKAALEASVRYLAADLGEKNIRVNAISAGPIKTLAASGIGDFRYILKWNEYNAPLRRTVTTEEVGDSALYLLSDMSRGVTGEVHHVDSGYHVVGMKRPDAPDISLAKD